MSYWVVVIIPCLHNVFASSMFVYSSNYLSLTIFFIYLPCQTLEKGYCLGLIDKKRYTPNTVALCRYSAFTLPDTVTNTITRFIVLLFSDFTCQKRINLQVTIAYVVPLNRMFLQDDCGDALHWKPSPIGCGCYSTMRHGSIAFCVCPY